MLLAAVEGPTPQLEALLTAMDQDASWADFNPAWTACIRTWLAEHP